MYKAAERTFIMMFFMIFSLVISTPANAEAAAKLTLATGEYAPYTSSEMEGYGLMTEIVSAVIKEMGVEAEYVFYPWKRCEYSVKKGKVWATFPYGYTEKRAAEFFFSDNILVTATKFFYYKKHHKETMTWETLDDLLPYTIGGVLGYYYEDEFKQAGLNVDYANSEELTLRKLVRGRVDLFPSDEAIAWNLIKKYFPEEIDNFGVMEKAHEKSGNCLMVSKTYPNSRELLKQFNAALKRIKENGVVERILRKYDMSSQ